MPLKPSLMAAEPAGFARQYQPSRAPGAARKALNGNARSHCPRDPATIEQTTGTGRANEAGRDFRNCRMPTIRGLMS
jgi:hypothetical protein